MFLNQQKLSHLTFQWLSDLLFIEQFGHEAISFLFHNRQSGLNLVWNIFREKITAEAGAQYKMLIFVFQV